MNEVAKTTGSDPKEMAKLAYILYLVGLVIGVTGIVGVIIAYVHKKDAPEWLQSHYRFQIRTFWIGFLYMFVGTLTSVILIGFFIMIFWMVWLILRCVNGMKALDEGKPHPNPATWFF